MHTDRLGKVGSIRRTKGTPRAETQPPKRRQLGAIVDESLWNQIPASLLLTKGAQPLRSWMTPCGCT